ncbi:MAG: hypothetical protein ACRDDZ_04330 [Marinifilaceae bacterium]
MKKGIVLSVITLLLVGAIVGSVWYFNSQKEIATSQKELFIPNNSALVINMNCASEDIYRNNAHIAKHIDNLKHSVMTQLTDTLCKLPGVDAMNRVVAYRVEGRMQVVSLTLLNLTDVVSKGRVLDVAKAKMRCTEHEERDFADFKISTLRGKDKSVYLAICGGIVLLSDSQLYIEDGIKQYGESESKETMSGSYRNVGKYLSSKASVNFFVSETFFRNFLPQFIDMQKMAPMSELTELFRWGALDAEIKGGGIALNGFMSYNEQGKTFVRSLAGQSPREGKILQVVPSSAYSVKLLNLSDMDRYMTELDNYRHSAHLKRKSVQRSEELAKLYGKDIREAFIPQLKGEVAVATLGFQPAKGEADGLLIADIKSGSLCKTLLGDMLSCYAGKSGVAEKSLHGTIQMADKHDYFRMPHADVMGVLLGYDIADINTRYAMVDEDYLVMASSEDMLKKYLLHRRAKQAVNTTSWYKNMETQLTKKYNLCYLNLLQPTLEQHQYVAKNNWRKYLEKKDTDLSSLTAMASQWSNESEMLYNHTYISTDSVAPVAEIKPQITTTVTTTNRMKPIKVKNHVNGSVEQFIQDDSLFIYLMDKNNKVLWKRKLTERINSEVFQIDAFKNNKLQLLFSTSTRMYLIDRTGKDVSGYPVRFADKAQKGITLYDYDRTKEYRIFVPLANKQVILYDQKGDVVKGWNPSPADKDIVSEIMHFRVGGKDYIVYADKVRLYILNRRGEERVKISSPMDIGNSARVRLVQDKMAYIEVSGAKNKYKVSFEGKVDKI